MLHLCLKNDKFLFWLRFRYAWSLFIERTEKEKVNVQKILDKVAKCTYNKIIRCLEEVYSGWKGLFSLTGEGKYSMKSMKIDANGTEIRVMGDIVNEDAYISLTDIAKYKNPDNAFIVVANWMRNHSTISFLGLWEQIHNPNFKPIEFDRFKAESGDNAFTLTPHQWIKATNAVGIISKSGRYGGTYAHTDIAFEFASWISPEFKLYIIKDYQRLKRDEANRLAIGWDAKRELSKINYRIHTDAVREFLITPTLSPQEMAYTYASEADILNMALFGKTAAQWRNEKGISGKAPNIRDFASAEELVVLINLEDTNADLIRQEVPKIERLKILREKAYRQLGILKKRQETIEVLKQNLIGNVRKKD